MSIEINPNAGPAGKGTNVEQVGANKSRAAEHPNKPAENASRDKVTLTSEAEKLQQLDALIKSTPDVDVAKVEALKQQIADGTFKVDSAAIADQLVNNQKE